jgi:hypothetical protein
MNETNKPNKANNFLFKIYLYLKNKFDPQKQISDEEKFCYDICKKLINKPTSKLTIAPVSNKRYIKNDESNMFIVIANGSIMLINHVYSYNIYCEYNEKYSELIKMFDTEVEKKILELEDEIKSNIQHSLKKILEGLS